MRVERDAVADRRPLRIRRLGPSIRRVRNAGPKAPTLSAVAGQVDPFLVLGDLSGARCGGGPPRIAYSQNWTLEFANASRRAKSTRIKYCPRIG